MPDNDFTRFKRRSNVRFAFTSSERKALFILAALFLIGLTVLQIRRGIERDTGNVTILSASPLDTLTLRSTGDKAAPHSQVDFDKLPAGEHERPQIYYLTHESSSAEDQSESGAEMLNPINLNKANETQLQTLTGIGPVLAGRIVDFRREHGRFIQVDDLSLVRGIGEKKLNKIRPYVTVK